MTLTSAAEPLLRSRPEVPRGGHARRVRDALSGYTFLAPAVLLLGVFLFVPLVWALVLSFQRTNGFGSGVFDGGANYARLVTDPSFWHAALTTVVFTAVVVPAELAGGLALAVLMNSVLPARGLFRTAVVLPMSISGVATALMGTLVFDEHIGIADKLLGSFGLGSPPWQSGGVAAFASVVLTTLWWRVGFNMVIYLAGLQGIAPELYESARIDGAGGWQLFRFVTWPMVGPSTFFLLIMDVIYTFHVFDIVYVLTKGGPGDATNVLVTYAYDNGFVVRDQGYATAIGMVLLVVTLVFTVAYWRASRGRDLVD